MSCGGFVSANFFCKSFLSTCLLETKHALLYSAELGAEINSDVLEKLESLRYNRFCFICFVFFN